MDNFKARTSYLRLGDLKFDPAYQRVGSLNQQRINEIAKNFDPAAVGTLLVSERNDDSLWVIDGMHRALAMIKAFDEDARARCTVFIGMTLEQEARAFYMQTRRTSVTPVNQFQARLISGETVAVELQRIISRWGYSVANVKMGKSIKAINTLDEIYRRHGGATVERIMSIIGMALDDLNESPDMSLMTGVLEMLLRYEINDERLSTTIRNLDRAKLRRDAVAINELLGGRTAAERVAFILHREYNRGRKNRLPDFLTTVRQKTVLPAAK